MTTSTHQRLRSRVAVGAMSVACCIGGCDGSKQATKSNTSMEKPTMTVATVTSKSTLFNRDIKVSGAVAPWQESILAAQLGPLSITSVRVDVGSRVHQGEVLATLDASLIKADVMKHEAALALAQSSLTQADADVRRATQVIDTGSLSQQAIEQYNTAARSAKAAVMSAQADLSADRIKLSQSEIRAVDDGMISSRTAALGDIANAGTELFRLVRQNRLEWRAEISSSELLLIQLGTLALVDVGSTQPLEGKVRVVSPSVNLNTRLGLAYVELASGSPVHTGGYYTGVLRVGQDKVETLPSTAIVSRDGESFVFVLDGTTVHQKEVKVGRQVGTMSEVLSGIDHRELVVQEGGIFLQDGDTVRATSD